MNLTIEDRHKIQPFIDWLVDSKRVNEGSFLFSAMEDYLKWLQKGREALAEINNDSSPGPSVCLLCDGEGRRVFKNCTPPIDEICPACNGKG